MNPLLSAALAYAAQGWVVLPLHTPTVRGCSCGADCGGSVGKHPRTTHGLYDASRQPDQIARWWRYWPDANIGIRTGRESSLVVLDVDARHAGEASLETLQATYATLPQTLTASSGGGGRHLYFQHPGPRILNRAEVGGYTGLDVRGDGGYIVAPPSLHQSGQLYRWLEVASPLAILPDWLSALLAPPPTPAPLVLPRSRGKLQSDPQSWLRLVLERARPGARNSIGYWLACRLRDAGLSFPEAEVLLVCYAAQVDDGDHPYTTREALASLRSAYLHPALVPTSRQ
jgi:hypothetical protein